MEEKETREKLDNITGTLQHLIEQTQVKASLLKLEAQQTWQDMEGVFFRIQSKLKQNKDEAGLQAHLAMMEAKQEWEEFKDEFSDYVEKLSAGEKVDHAKVQAHLAKMEMEDRFAKEKKEWEKAYEEKVKPRLKKSMEEMQSEMNTMAKSWID